MKFYWNYDKKMVRKTFNKIRKEVFDDCIRISDGKSVEYTMSSDDILANFKNIAERLSVSQEIVLMTYMLKHTDAMCNDAKTGKQYSDETTIERCKDVINYCLLRIAQILEKQTTHTEDSNNEDNTKPNRNGTSSNSGYESNGSKPDKWNQLKRNEKTRPRY